MIGDGPTLFQVFVFVSSLLKNERTERKNQPIKVKENVYITNTQKNEHTKQITTHIVNIYEIN